MSLLKQEFTTDSGFDQRGPPAWYLGVAKV
jgi:hypothetical protein